MTMFSRAALIGTAAAAIASAALFTTMSLADAGKPTIGAWGFDLEGMDRSVKPGDDFFKFVGGTWMKNTPIPPDRARWGSFPILGAKSEEDVRAIVEDVSKQANTPGSIPQKVADFYNTYLDTKAIEDKGLAPVQGDLDRIAAAQTPDDVMKLMADPAMPVDGPIGMGVRLDNKNPDRYVLGVGQSGLGMPDRDYYLKPDQRFADVRVKYRAYIEQMLKLADIDDASKKADAIMAVETKIAEIHWPNEQRRDRDKTYNPKTLAELKAFAPEVPWDLALSTMGTPNQNFFIVAEIDAVQKLAKLWRETPVETWRAYMTFHYLDAMADVLPVAFDDASFDFNGKVLTGQPEKRERWKRAAAGLQGALGEAVGQLYVVRHFSPASKAAMKELVENLRAAYRVRIGKLTWMSAETKKAALKKLDTLNVKIGYPDKWRDYSQLEIKAGDAVGNVRRMAAWNWKRDQERLTKPADRSEWGMAPQTVNAYYRSTWNEIVFPAAILQAPFFDINADPAVNYGGIGAVIGHEMGHGFDDQGAKSDERGVLRRWWKPEDEERFKKLTGGLAAQYSTFEALPGLRVNGAFTLGENIGDLGGLNVSYEAYKISLKGKEAPVLDGFSGEQRFFLGFAQVWRTIARDEFVRNQVVSDPHSPAQFRCNGTVRNMEQWYEAFDVKPENAMYLKPEDRVRIW